MKRRRPSLAVGLCVTAILSCLACEEQERYDQYTEQQARDASGKLAFKDATDVRFLNYMPDESLWVFSYRWPDATPERWRNEARQVQPCYQPLALGPNSISLSSTSRDCEGDIVEVVIRDSDKRVFVARAFAVMGEPRRRAIARSVLQDLCWCMRRD